MYVEITADRTMGETTLVETGGCIPIPVRIEGGGKGDGGFHGVWCGDGGRGAEGRCGIVDETAN